MSSGKISDKRIKRLLLSSNESEFIEGLALLDEKYRGLMTGRIRGWAVAKWLPAQDLADIWQEVVCAVASNVVTGKYDPAGNLSGYLGRIARNKCIDVLRDRMTRINEGYDCENLADTNSEISPEFIEAVEASLRTLGWSLQMVIRVDVSMFICSGGEWISLAELTNEVNYQYGLTLPETTVKPRRARGRSQFKEALLERGYGV